MSDNVLDFIDPEEYIKQMFKLAFKTQDGYTNAVLILEKFMNKFKKEFPKKLDKNYNLNLVVNLISLANEILKQHLEEAALEHSSFEMIMK